MLNAINFTMTSKEIIALIDDRICNVVINKIVNNYSKKFRNLDLSNLI